MITEIYKGFTLTLEATQDNQTLAQLYADSEASYDLASLEKAVACGDMLHFCAKVTCSRGGVELSGEYVGGCVYDSLDDFKHNSGYYDEMCDTAVESALERIRALNVEDV